jgi:hypothetical protein
MDSHMIEELTVSIFRVCMGRKDRRGRFFQNVGNSLIAG